MNNLPTDWHWTRFAIGRHQTAPVAASVLAGGNMGVGLDDNFWLDKGVLPTNAALVEHAPSVIQKHGARVIGADELRARPQLTNR